MSLDIHPINSDVLHSNLSTADSRKSWLRQYEPIPPGKIRPEIWVDLHTTRMRDDDARRQIPVPEPCQRARWTLEDEADCIDFFLAEYVNPVLARFVDAPAAEVVRERSIGGLRVDFQIRLVSNNKILAVGEGKRAAIQRRYWTGDSATRDSASERLSQELRGYVMLLL